MANSVLVDLELRRRAMELLKDDIGITMSDRA